MELLLKTRPEDGYPGLSHEAVYNGTFLLGVLLRIIRFGVNPAEDALREYRVLSHEEANRPPLMMTMLREDKTGAIYEVDGFVIVISRLKNQRDAVLSPDKFAGMHPLDALSKKTCRFVYDQARNMHLGQTVLDDS